MTQNGSVFLYNVFFWTQFIFEFQFLDLLRILFFFQSTTLSGVILKSGNIKQTEPSCLHPLVMDVLTNAWLTLSRVKKDK